MSLLECTALELADKIKKKECTCQDAVQAVFAQIEKQEKNYHCYILSLIHI